MKSLLKIFIASILLFVAFPAFANARADLNLWKFDPFFYGACGWCGDFVNFSENENRTEFTDFNLYNQSGYYTAVLDGPAGTTVTLFGDFGYGTEQGYLIIVKKDDSTVEIENLEEFSPGSWVDIAAGDSGSGAFSVYYRSSPNFKSRIASVKWGQWWSNLN